jgi:thiol-disulfide isomerase/thioredoxin
LAPWGLLDGLLHPVRHRQKIDVCVVTTTFVNGHTMKLLHSALVIAAAIVSYFSPAQAATAWAKDDDDATNAAELVRSFRKSQEWIHNVHAMSLRMEGQRVEPLTGRRFAETVEVGFDRSRLRSSIAVKGLTHELRVWDGRRATCYSVPHRAEVGSFILSSSAYDIGDYMFDGTYWLWLQPHNFWWSRPVNDPAKRSQAESLYGTPDDFIVTGRVVYRGIPCYVLHRKNWFLVRFYVGEKTGLLHGRLDGSLPGNPERDRAASKVAAAHGKKLKTYQEFEEWTRSLARQKADLLVQAVFEECFPSDHPRRETWLLDYKEVQPGRWFPRTQGYACYHGTYEKPVTEFTTELKTVELKPDEPLPDALFTPPAMLEGAEIFDRTVEPPLAYKHKADRTPAEWQAMLAAARRERQADETQQALRDELVGTPAQEFPEGEWLNGSKRSLKAFKGKPVLLIFWAEWCGPCHGSLPDVKKSDDGSPFTVIGVHTPRSPRERVAMALKKAEADGAVFIDSAEGEDGAGFLFTRYRLTFLPSAVLLDADGRVAAVGHVDAVRHKLNELLEAVNK